MMYIRDDVVDEVLRGQQPIQDAIRGKRFLLWPPGMGAYMVFNSCALVSCMGIAFALSRWMRSYEGSVLFLATCAIVMGAHGVIGFQVLRGWPRARFRMYRFTAVLVILSGVATAASLALDVRHGAIAACIGLLASVGTRRIVAGTGYATFAGFYRVKRMVELEMRQLVSSVRKQTFDAGEPDHF